MSNTSNIPHLMYTTFFFMLILIDVFIVRKYSDIVLYFILIAYFINSYINKISSGNGFLLAGALIVLTGVMFTTVGVTEATERVAAWVYFLLLIGIIQNLRE